MSKFSDFIKSDNNNYSIKTDKVESDINDLIDKYSTYTESDLMKEFLQETEKKKTNGELDEDKINSIKKVLLPYLSESQYERLNQLMDMVKYD